MNASGLRRPGATGWRPRLSRRIVGSRTSVPDALAVLSAVVPGLLAIVLWTTDGHAQSVDGSNSGHEEPVAAAVDAMEQGRTMTANELFNAGLGFAGQSDTGRAVLAMERAQLLRPLDRDIYDARQRIQTAARTAHAERTGSQRFHVGEPSRVGWWRSMRSFPLWWAQLLMVVGAWSVAAAGFHAIARPAASSTHRGVRLAVTLVGGSFALAGGLLQFGHDVWTASVRPHVVIASSPACRDAPDELARTRRHPDMYSGAIVRAAEFRSPWVRIELAGGDSVWVAESDVAPIDPAEDRAR